MPESPDFDQIARTLVEAQINAHHYEPIGILAMVVTIAEQLRQVWNARGAADRATIEGALSSQMGATAAGPYVKNLDRALRDLDR